MKYRQPDEQSTQPGGRSVPVGQTAPRRQPRPSGSDRQQTQSGAGRQHVQNTADRQQPTADRQQTQSGAGRQMTQNPAHVSAERLARIERRKARSRAASLAMTVMLIMLVTVVAIILVMRQTKPRPRFLFIQTGEMVHQIDATGLILRDEQVFTAPVAGTLKPLAGEGTRVGKGQKLAMIIPQGQEDELASLQKIERDIIDLQNELMNDGKGAGARAIYDESAASLTTVINLVRSDLSRGTLENLDAYEASLSVILDQRTAMLMKIDFDDARLDSLQQSRDALEDQLGIDAGTLVCQQPGLVSFKLDGLESDLNLLSASTLTIDDYRRLVDEAEPPKTISNPVGKDSPVLRIAANLYQVLVFYLPETEPSRFVINEIHTINIPADGVIIENCQVLRSVADGTGTLVVFKTDRKVEWLAERRLVQAEIPVSRQTGLKVPLTSLVDLNDETNQASLMIVDGGYTRMCQVDILDSDRESAIVEPVEADKDLLAVSSILVVNPESIEEGEFIGN